MYCFSFESICIDVRSLSIKLVFIHTLVRSPRCLVKDHSSK
jgi:hypothetical protein